jgi:hypothetical protein
MFLPHLIIRTQSVFFAEVGEMTPTIAMIARNFITPIIFSLIDFLKYEFENKMNFENGFQIASIYTLFDSFLTTLLKNMIN